MNFFWWWSVLLGCHADKSLTCNKPPRQNKHADQLELPICILVLGQWLICIRSANSFRNRRIVTVWCEPPIMPWSLAVMLYWREKYPILFWFLRPISLYLAKIIFPMRNNFFIHAKWKKSIDCLDNKHFPNVEVQGKDWKKEYMFLNQ